MHLMDLRETDILDNSVEEDVGDGGHVEERSGMFLYYGI